MNEGAITVTFSMSDYKQDLVQIGIIIGIIRAIRDLRGYALNNVYTAMDEWRTNYIVKTRGCIELYETVCEEISLAFNKAPSCSFEFDLNESED